MNAEELQTQIAVEQSTGDAIREEVETLRSYLQEFQNIKAHVTEEQYEQLKAFLRTPQAFGSYGRDEGGPGYFKFSGVDLDRVEERRNEIARREVTYQERRRLDSQLANEKEYTARLREERTTLLQHISNVAGVTMHSVQDVQQKYNEAYQWYASLQDSDVESSDVGGDDSAGEDLPQNTAAHNSPAQHSSEALVIYDPTLPVATPMAAGALQGSRPQHVEDSEVGSDYEEEDRKTADDDTATVQAEEGQGLVRAVGLPLSYSMHNLPSGYVVGVVPEGGLHEDSDAVDDPAPEVREVAEPQRAVALPRTDPSGSVASALSQEGSASAASSADAGAAMALSELTSAHASKLFDTVNTLEALRDHVLDIPIWTIPQFELIFDAAQHINNGRSAQVFSSAYATTMLVQLSQYKNQLYGAPDDGFEKPCTYRLDWDSKEMFGINLSRFAVRSIESFMRNRDWEAFKEAYVAELENATRCTLDRWSRTASSIIQQPQMKAPLRNVKKSCDALSTLTNATAIVLLTVLSATGQPLLKDYCERDVSGLHSAILKNTKNIIDTMQVATYKTKSITELKRFYVFPLRHLHSLLTSLSLCCPE